MKDQNKNYKNVGFWILILHTLELLLKLEIVKHALRVVYAKKRESLEQSPSDLCPQACGLRPTYEVLQ